MPETIGLAKGRDDRLGLALITLAHEVWVMRDRQIIMEAVLAANGLLDDLDRYQPDDDLSAKIGGERERFIGAITTVLSTGKPSDT